MAGLLGKTIPAEHLRNIRQFTLASPGVVNYAYMSSTNINDTHECIAPQHRPLPNPLIIGYRYKEIGARFDSLPFVDGPAELASQWILSSLCRANVKVTLCGVPTDGDCVIICERDNMCGLCCSE